MAPLVHVIDEDGSFRASLGRWLRSCGLETALHENCEQFTHQTVDDTKPSCIIVECRMTTMSGLELQRYLIECGSILPMIFLTNSGDIPSAVLAIKAGAVDFLTKPVSKKRLLQVIEGALFKWYGASDRRNRADALRASVDALTPRERTILERVHHGRLNKQIAFEFGISDRTVKAYRQSIKRKLQVSSLAEMISIAERANVQPAQPQ